MMHNIDINKMNRLMEENKEAKQIISQLLENHQVTVSTIAHEIRNPLTLVSSALQIIQVQHPEVKEFSHWKQTMDDIDFMRQLLEELSTFNNGNTLHYSVFSIEHLLKILPYPLRFRWMKKSPKSNFHPPSRTASANLQAIRSRLKKFS